jgi:hypothetical protein
MILTIHSGKTLFDIQSEFNKIFPFLKLEFFGSKQQHSNPLNTRIGNPVLAPTDIEIIDTMKVSELESKLSTALKINVQVFRRSGNLWLETTMTDNWSLLQQNQHGCEISKSMHPQHIAEEYDLNRDADH